MVVQDIIDLAKIRLSNLPVVKNEDALIKFIYLGVSELYRRFNLSIKAETVITNDNLSMYELRNHDVGFILGIYDSAGNELKQTDVYNALSYDYKLVNYKSFILKVPFKGYLTAVYTASPTVFQDTKDIVDLPDAMIDALLNYVSYMAHSTVNTDGAVESNVFLQRFNEACKELDMQGYKIPLNPETVGVYARGYV